ncbi:MAG: hypothetical protein NT010_03845 [Proteobacteria bacterium]|nr:hypothetical protein [Pseudomonadota bacterium]
MFFWLSESDKYDITSYAFRYFMFSNLGIKASVVKAVKKVRPDRIRKDGTLKLSKSTFIELEMRIKNML